MHKQTLFFFNINSKYPQYKSSYSFFFRSLIAPYITPSLRLLFNDNRNTSKKLLLKQSYILLTWIYYLTNVKNIYEDKRYFNFYTLPTRTHKTTITKAPMAHKNWSKEQFKFQHFSIKISFYFNLPYAFKLRTTNAALLFFFLTQKQFPAFETSLLFLKSYSLKTSFQDSHFFNYYKFLN